MAFMACDIEDSAHGTDRTEKSGMPETKDKCPVSAHGQAGDAAQTVCGETLFDIRNKFIQKIRLDLIVLNKSTVRIPSEASAFGVTMIIPYLDTRLANNVFGVILQAV